MKNLLQLLLLLFTCGINAFAQPNETFKLSTNKPETGKDIGFVYTFSLTKISRQFIYLIYQKGEHVQQKSLQGKYSRGRLEGKFRLPDSVYAFRIQPGNEKNGNEIAILKVHKNGRPVKGSYAATAQFYGKAGTGIRDVKKSLSLFRQEFAMNPELKPQYLLDYFSAGHFNPDSIILKELVQTAQDSIEHGTNETFLTKFYDIAVNYGNVELNDKLKSHLLTKYPSGQLAFKLANADFWDVYNKGDYLKTFWELERKFPELIAAGALDETYNLFARQQFQKGSIEQGEIYLHKIKNRDLQRELYAYAASQAAYSHRNYVQAAFYIKTAIDIAEKKGVYKSGYLLTSGQIQHAMGNLDAALSYVKASLSLPNHGTTQTLVYLQYLQEAGQYRKALKVAEGCVKSWSESSAIKSSFIDIYRKVKGNDAGAEERYQALIKIRDDGLTPPKYNELDVPSINFTMNDIQGTPFTLSKLVGKSVVLYFFSVPKTARAAMSNEYFKKAATEYQSSGHVVFIGIEKSYNQSISGPVAQAERVEKLKKYIERNNITYQVIPDHWILGNNIYGGHFKLSAEYSVNGPSQFFIIDKKGTIRYKSSGSMHVPEQFYTELKAALKLIK